MARKNKFAAMFTLRADGRYQTKYSDESGLHYLYDRDPEKLYEKLQTKLTQEKKNPTFREVAEEWEHDHRQEVGTRTWNNYAPHLREMKVNHGETEIDKMEAADVSNDLARAKAKGYSATVVNTRRSIFQMIFDYAVVKGYLKYNPATSVKLPKGLTRGKRRAPTDEEIKIICKNVDTAPFGLFPFFVLCTGLRKSEALALDWSDIDLDGKEIYITKSLDYTIESKPTVKEPKTKAGTRTVPIVDALIPYLKKGGTGPVFPCPSSNRGGKGGGYMTEKSYEGAWLRYCQFVGLMDGDKPALTAHQLRHGAATLMFETGVDELTTQRIMGHSRVEITRSIYTDLRSKQKRKSVSKFNRGVSKMVSSSKKC